MRRALPLLAILLAGCIAQAAPSHRLAGSEWRFTSIDGQAPASDKAILAFDADRLGVNVGCNGMGGAWNVENGRLIAGPLVQTEMYCSGPVWNQEQAISALLVAAPELVLDGDRLLLRSRGHFAELTRIAAAAEGS